MTSAASRIIGSIFLVTMIISAEFFILMTLPENAEADTGGPDNGGYYTWIDNNPPLPSVNYSWVEISGTGFGVGSLGEDYRYGPFSLDFTFDFYGIPYTQIWINHNGYVTFNNEAPDYINDPIPSSREPNNIIAPLWDDLAGGQIYCQTQGTAPDRYFVVEWQDMVRFGQQTTDTVTFQLILYERTNLIKFQYKDVYFNDTRWDWGAHATIGIENRTGGTGLQYSYKSASLSNNLAIEFYRYTFDYIMISDSAGPGGNWVNDFHYSIGNNDKFYANGFNDSAGFIGDVYVNWITSDSSVCEINDSGHSTVFTALSEGTCILTATYKGTLINTSGLITVFRAPEILNVTYFPDFPNGSSTVNIYANITDIDGIGSVTLYYSLDGFSYMPLGMNWVIGDLYSGNIPGSGSTTTVYYYIEATDMNGYLNSSSIFTYMTEGDLPELNRLFLYPEYPNPTVDIDTFISIIDENDLQNVTIKYSYDNFTWFQHSMDHWAQWVFFHDTFLTNAINISNWESTQGSPWINIDASNEPSPPYSLEIDGGGDVIISFPIDLSGLSKVNISFLYELGGNRNAPESNDWLYLYYFNESGNWSNLWKINGDGNCHFTFNKVELTLPSDAYHSDFRFKFTSTGELGLDDFFIDDIIVALANTANASIPAPGFSTWIYCYFNATDIYGNFNQSKVFKFYADGFPPKVIHTSDVTSPIASYTEVPIFTNVTDNYGFSFNNVILWYDNGSGWTSIPMTYVSGNHTNATVIGNIPFTNSSTTVFYYVEVTDNASNSNDSGIPKSYSTNFPPIIENVTFSPEFPNGTTTVTVYANISDIDGIDLPGTRLYYSINGALYSSVAMVPVSGTTYSADVPGPGKSSTVYFYINATDGNGFIKSTQIFNYYVDGDPPSFGIPKTDPRQPNATADVNVTMFLTDDVNVTNATLWHSYDGMVWSPTPMQTYYCGKPDRVLFEDTFPSSTKDTSKWGGWSYSPTITAKGINEPSPPYSLEINGTSEDINTQYLDLSGYIYVCINFSYQMGGGGEAPDSTDWLYLKYYNGANTWVQLWQQNGDDTNHDTYEQIELVLPPDAYHSGFKFKFGISGDGVGDFYIDDVRLICYQHANGTIPAPGYSTWVYYYVNATDIEGNLGTSSIYKYYTDSIDPNVIDVSDVASPKNAYDTVPIFANITDDFGLDFNNIHLWYNYSNDWISTPMSYHSGNYTSATFIGYIPPANSETTISYYVEVFDNASYSNNSEPSKSYSTNFAPVIENISHHPEHPNAIDPVTISANITDNDGVTGSTLYYSFGGITYSSVPMSFVGGDTYSGDIPGPISTGYVFYYINVTDINDLINSTPVFSYFADSDPPGFDLPTINPDPANETVDVEVNIHFVDDSEIIDAVLYYSFDNITWTQIDMNLLGGNNANGIIPSPGFPTTVYYYISATEAAGNNNESITYIYPAGPELMLTPDNVNFSPFPVENGSAVFINATFLNMGEALDIVNVSFFLDNPDVDNNNIVDSDAVLLGTKSTFFVGAQNTALVSINWTPPHIGFYDIYVWVDVTNSTREVNESNNIAYKTLPVHNWVDSFDNLSKTESKQNITYYDGDARTGFGYTLDFEDSDEGFVLESGPPWNKIKWDSSNERIFFYIRYSDFVKEDMYLKSLPKTLNETNGSWILSAKFKITSGGHLQLAYPLFITDSSSTRVSEIANTIYFQYAAGDDTVYVVFRDSNSNVHGFSKGISINQEYLAKVIYDHVTKRLTLQLISYTWVRQVSVIVGTDPVGNFTFGKIGVGGYKYWGSDPPLIGWTDDISFKFFGKINGTMVSKPITIPANNTWSQLYIDKNEPENTNITVTIVNAASGEPITGFINLTGSTINMAGLNPNLYPSIKLVANFIVEGMAVPVMHYWALDWEEINLAPQADAGPDGFVNEGIQYMFNGSASINSTGAWFNWSFDDGSYENGTNMFPVHVYEIPGLYEVTLKVTNSTGWDIDKCWITVFDVTKPVVDAGTDGTIDEDIMYYFNATDSYDPEDGTVEWYNWTFGDGSYNNGSDPIPNHTYENPGVYIVILNISDLAGNWNSTTIAIVVNDTTPPVANAGGDISTYAGVPIELDASLTTDNNGTAGLNYSWDVNGDLIPDYYGVTTIHTYFATDVYTVTLNVTDKAGNWNVTAIQINIVIPPHPIANAGTDGFVNEGMPYYMDGSLSINDTGAWFNWSFDDGFYDNGTNMFPSHTYEIPGMYVVILTVTNSTGWSTDTCNITVYDITKPFSDAGPVGIVSEDEPYQFDGTGSFDPEGGSIA